MTNIEAKQQAIEDAWGETIYKVMDAIMKREEPSYYRGFTEHGEVYGNFVPDLLKRHLNDERITNLDGWYKPKELRGIENNNGWNRIDSISSYPKETGIYSIMDSGVYFEYVDYDSKKNLWHRFEFKYNPTHWRQIPNVPKPIY